MTTTKEEEEEEEGVLCKSLKLIHIDIGRNKTFITDARFTNTYKSNETNDSQNDSLLIWVTSVSYDNDNDNDVNDNNGDDDDDDNDDDDDAWNTLDILSLKYV
ncbi:hypothetical protein V1478_002792 [Vespula squamosa]|uniref:Uncharacterized protein n=1 Tax=Vespula squamosa TaxID=30214 RepID=A0ABD2BQU9_VESSQ